jgi:hypothetical protein
MVVLGLGFKKDQTLRRSRPLGEAFVEEPSRFYTAVAMHVANGKIIRVYENTKDVTVP